MSSRAQLPNIVWIMTDEQRCDSLGCYGSSWAKTPTIDSLAKRGTMFSTAITAAPVCIPARTSILSAKTPARTGVWQNSENPRRQPGTTGLISAFAGRGYRCASFGKQHYQLDERAFEHEEQLVLSDLVDYTRFAPGFDEEAAGVIKFDGPTAWILGGTFPGDAALAPESVVVDRAISWLDSLDGTSPYFLRVSYNGPHTPVVPPAPFDTMIPPESIVYPPECEPRLEPAPKWLDSLVDEYSGSDRLDPRNIPRMRSYYYGYSAFLDAVTARLMERIDIDNTVIFYTSDHGTHIGDHGLVQKQTFFEPVVNVPCFVSWPGHIPAELRIDTPVETRHLLPAIARLTCVDGGDENSGFPDGSGNGILDALSTGQEPPRRPVLSEFTLNPRHIRTQHRLVMARLESMKLVLDSDGEPENPWLFDLELDPFETVNVYGKSKYSNQQRALEEFVASELDPAAPA